VVRRAAHLGGVLASLASLVLGCASPPAPDASGSLLPMHPDARGPLPTAPAPSPSSRGPAAPAPRPTSPSGSAAYRVEPGGRYATLAAVAPLLQPGDVVEIVGAATYDGGVRFTRDGLPEAKIVVRGVPVDGKRPVIAGGADTIEAAGDHYVFEGLEITGGSKRCFFHHAHDVTLRASLVRDCPQQGILGADDDSGDLTLEHVEVTRSGNGIYSHQIYMATDERAHPGSVFRMRHCYVHDGAGGNNVKSRAERNELHYNWIEGARYHEVEMVGPDGADPALAREDGELVGNVLVKTTDFYVVRLGGDGTGATGGRYRLAHNTFVLQGSQSAIRLMDAVESVEAYNNVFYRAGGSGISVFADQAKWTTGRPVLVGANNFVPQGSLPPVSWAATVFGTDPRFTSFAGSDYRPAPTSPLLGVGAPNPVNPAEPSFPRPLARPESEPPMRAIGPARPRAAAARPALGAFEAAERR
jgi:hypothetical protein